MLNAAIRIFFHDVLAENRNKNRRFLLFSSVLSVFLQISPDSASFLAFGIFHNGFGAFFERRRLPL